MALKIGVLMGGLSLEKEVSLSSGRTVCDHLDTTQYTAIPLFQSAENKLYILPWKFLYRGKITDFEHRLATEAREILWDDLPGLIDFMYIAQHGRYAEDGRLQGLLEVLDVPYLGSKILASAIGMDKAFQKKILAAHGIATPRSITVHPSDATDLRTQLKQAQIPFPVVVKPVQEGSSLGISVAHTLEECEKAVMTAMYVNSELLQPVLVEEFIEGMEFTCITLLDPVTGAVTAFPPTELVKETQFGIHTYEHKYMPGRAQKPTPARCSKETLAHIQEVALATTKALGFCTISRIDGFVTKDGSIVIVDPNTLCGMAPSSFFFIQAAQMGFSHSAIINHLIASELRGYSMTFGQLENDLPTTTNTTAKIKIGVLLGGNSNERETSLNSGRNVCYKLSPEKYEITPLFLDSNLHIYPLSQRLLVHNTTAAIAEEVDAASRITWSSLKENFDFIFIGLHGGAGENGAIQGTLEMLQIPYNGSGVLASALAMNKWETNKFLKSQGFSVPEHVLVAKSAWLTDAATTLQTVMNTLTFPCIVKPHDDGCSVMVFKVHTKEELQESLTTLFTHGKEQALVEEFVKGMELTVGVIGNEKAQALPPSQSVAAHGVLSMEEKFLPGAGENQTPAPIPAHALALVQQTVEQVYETVGCSGYVRIDCFYQTTDQSPTGNERVVILEINTLPALTPATCLFHQAAEVGIRPMELIDRIVTLGLEKHDKLAASNKKLIAQKEL